MIRNYFKTAWRNILRYRFYSIVNVLGLFTGITFTLLIGSYVWGELQVNRKLRNAKNQYFLKSLWKDPNLGLDLTSLGPLAKRLKEDYPNLVANYYRWDGVTSNVSNGEKVFREGLQLGDSTFLSMFGFELLHGDAKTALNNPFSLVITGDMAVKYFGKTNVVGQTLSIQSFSGTKNPFNITGVLKEIPQNSVMHINPQNDNKFFIPISAMAYFGRIPVENWTNIYIPSYIELQNGITPKDLEKPIRQLIQTNAPVGIKENLTVQTVHLPDYYLNADRGLVKRMLYTLSFVATFILLMAVVNFINISISRSSSRMKEIGIRKVLGGLRKQLTLQFLTESFILVMFATLLALLVFPIARPFFNSMIGKEIPSLSSFPLYFIFVPFALSLVVGILAGLYPAIVLSSLKSVESLKGKLQSVKENVFLRKSLVGFQFCIAAIVLIAAIIVTQQITYFFQTNLGYNREYIMAAQVPRDWTPQGVRKIETIRNEIAAMPEVSMASISYEIPDGMNGGQGPVYRADKDSTQSVATQYMVADEFYASTYQIPMKAGAFFTNSHGIDSSKIVLNEKAVQSLGWKDPGEAIGKQIRLPANPIIYTVEGVISDYHFASMQERIAPFIYFHIRTANVYRQLSLRINPGNIHQTISALQKKWQTVFPGSSFEYKFMDETLTKLYTTELQLKKAAYTATVLAMIIVLLGVVGLISLSVHKRIKEIGIRKVLGASLQNIIMLFVKDFIAIIIVAGVVAIPVAYLVMNGWLKNYAYRINISFQPFLWTIFSLASMTILLIAIQTVKTALANPVKSLRTE